MTDLDDCGVFALEELAPGDFVAQRLAHLESHAMALSGAAGEVHRRFLRLADLHLDRVAGDEFRRGALDRFGDFRVCALGACVLGRGLPGLGYAELCEVRELARHTLLDPSHSKVQGCAQALGREQALRQVIHGAELQGAHGRELITFFRQRDHDRGMRPRAQAAQHPDAVCLGILGT